LRKELDNEKKQNLTEIARLENQNLEASEVFKAQLGSCNAEIKILQGMIKEREDEIEQVNEELDKKELQLEKEQTQVAKLA
jgi:hypothetical protein